MSTKIIIGIWTAIVFLMFLSPPWIENLTIPSGTYGSHGAFEKTRSAGYHPIYLPPAETNSFASIKIDWQCFLFQLLGITALAGGSLLIKGRWSLWKLQVENKILEKQVEQFTLKNKLNELKEGPNEI